MCSKHPVKIFTSVLCRLKGFIPILNFYAFVMERQCGLRSYIQLIDGCDVLPKHNLNTTFANNHFSVFILP